MPREQEMKRCSFEGCKGAMTYSKSAIPPGKRTQFSKKGDRSVWGAPPQPGWVCSSVPEHFEAAPSK